MPPVALCTHTFNTTTRKLEKKMKYNYYVNFFVRTLGRLPFVHVTHSVFVERIFTKTPNSLRP